MNAQTVFYKPYSAIQIFKVHTVELEFTPDTNAEIYNFLVTHPEIDGIFG